MRISSSLAAIAAAALIWSAYSTAFFAIRSSSDSGLGIVQILLAVLNGATDADLPPHEDHYGAVSILGSIWSASGVARLGGPGALTGFGVPSGGIGSPGPQASFRAGHPTARAPSLPSDGEAIAASAA